MIISMIVAASKNGVIGIENQLPWRLSGDLKKFKAITTDHHVLLGRKTFDSIGRALPKRIMLVLSSGDYQDQENVHYFKNLNAAIDKAKENGEEELIVIGGEKVYRECLSIAHKVYFTRVDVELEGDAFFPELDDSVWKEDEKSIEQQAQDEKNQYAWKFSVYHKKN